MLARILSKYYENSKNPSVHEIICVAADIEKPHWRFYLFDLQDIGLVGASDPIDWGKILYQSPHLDLSRGWDRYYWLHEDVVQVIDGSNDGFLYLLKHDF